MAAIRAAESRKPAGERICYDAFAHRFADPVYLPIETRFNAYCEWRSPGFMGFVACRTRYIDDYLEACLKDGSAQVMILGAGLDSRAYRFPMLKEAVRVFEIDSPATQAAKLRRLRRVLGEVPQHVTFIPLDFNHETLDKLTGYGYDRSLRSRFRWEGVVMYLTPEAVDATLAWVRWHSAPGSHIIFDYIHRSAYSAKQRREEVRLSQWTRRFTGEGLVFGIEPDEIMEHMTRRGFTDVVNASAQDLQRLYCTGPNQGRAVADIYSIVHAAVP